MNNRAAPGPQAACPRPDRHVNLKSACHEEIAHMIRPFRQVLAGAVSVALTASAVLAQQPVKQKFTSIEEAAQASGALGGRSGPRSVNWIDDGERFAYTINNATTQAE